jgi:putative FmdB family regulatory protein
VPTYAYACTDCAHDFEVVQSFSDDSLSVCPICTGRLRKVFSNVGVVFKGSGFYRNDSRAPEKTSSDKSSAEKSSGDKGSSEKSSSGKPSGDKSSSEKGSGSGTGKKSADKVSATSGANGSSSAKTGSGSAA